MKEFGNGKKENKRIHLSKLRAATAAFLQGPQDTRKTLYSNIRLLQMLYKKDTVSYLVVIPRSFVSADSPYDR